MLPRRSAHLLLLSDGQLRDSPHLVDSMGEDFGWIIGAFQRIFECLRFHVGLVNGRGNAFNHLIRECCLFGRGVRFVIGGHGGECEDLSSSRVWWGCSAKQLYSALVAWLRTLVEVWREPRSWAPHGSKRALHYGLILEWAFEWCFALRGVSGEARTELLLSLVVIGCGRARVSQRVVWAVRHRVFSLADWAWVGARRQRLWCGWSCEGIERAGRYIVPLACTDGTSLPTGAVFHDVGGVLTDSAPNGARAVSGDVSRFSAIETNGRSHHIQGGHGRSRCTWWG